MLKLLDELVFTNPWRELDRWQNEVNSLFNGGFRPVSRDRRPVNIYTSDDSVKVVAVVPGWEPGWFDLTVEGKKLFLRGETRFEANDQGVNPPQEKLNRVVNLPFRAQEDQINAVYRDGILVVDLARSENDKPKKIAVETV
ncbi:MAG: Hsp20/alpha crystallin family protein [Acidobacteriota bacterium]|nr:Hsp20/alpha crystallin family protein [Acidobacteriota bacterium]